MKVNSISILKEGEGKNGKWRLAKATFEDGIERTGFVYDNVPEVGEDIDVEFFEEEYKGEMQKKFKLLGKKAQDSKLLEEINRKLDLIINHFKLELPF